MSPHLRVLLFCVSLLASPLLFDLGQRLGGTTGAVPLAVGVVGAAVWYAEAGQRKPPAGTRPA